MFNFYYVYSATWGTILFLYLLGWSSLNRPLNSSLLVFFLLTIALSICLGKRQSARFQFVRSTSAAMPVWAVLFILGCGAIGFAQLGYIPALNLLNQSYDYQEMLDRESSIFTTIGVVGSVFGCGYQFDRMLKNRGKSDIVKLSLFVVYLISFSSRGPLFISGITCLLIYFKYKNTKLMLRNVLLLIAIVAVALWAFGVLGNIRSGYEWNDSSYIYLLGHFEGRWPSFIPREYCWAYSYLTSPLANLNYSLTKTVQIDLVNFIYDFLPMMLAKRLPLYTTVQAPLQVPYFNVSSVWSNYYLHLDLIGLYLGYVLQFCILEMWVTVARKTAYEDLMKAYCSECVALSFFVNSFVYPTMGYPAVLLVCICLYQKATDGLKIRSRTSLKRPSRDQSTERDNLA